MNAAKSILIADDDHENLELILSFLDQDFADVYYAPNGKVAVEIAKQKKPNIIIMDWQMPVMSGLEALKLLIADPETQKVPVIIATGAMTASKDLEAAFEVGAFDFIRKPFDPIEFAARTYAALRQREQQREMEAILEREQQLLMEIIDRQQQELTQIATFDERKNLLSQRLLEEVERLDRLTNAEHAEQLKGITDDLRSQLNLSKSWDGFKLHFEEMHDGFFEKLDQQFAGLTNQQRKLCAYIKMGLSNIDICEITGATSNTLRRAINRLKKKLGLGPNQEIRTFFEEF